MHHRYHGMVYALHEARRPPVPRSMLEQPVLSREAARVETNPLEPVPLPPMQDSRESHHCPECLEAPAPVAGAGLRSRSREERARSVMLVAELELLP